MFPSRSSSSSANIQSVQAKTNETVSTKAVPEENFCSSFSEAKGDRILGLPSVTSKEHPAWTPARLLENLRVAFNIMAEQPEAYDFEGTPVSKVNDKPDTILDVEDALVIVVKEEQRRKKSGRDETVGSENIKADKTALSDVTSTASVEGVIAFVSGVFDYIVELEEKGKEGGGTNKDCSELSDKSLDELFSDLSRHPRYAHAFGLLETEKIQGKFSGGEAWRRIHESATYLFSNKSKSMIDEFVQQKSGGGPTAYLHIFLDDIEMGSVVGNKDLKAGGITAEELRHLYRCRAQLGDAVKFYKNNKTVSAPWEQDPKLWSDKLFSTDSTPTSSPQGTDDTSRTGNQEVPLYGRFVQPPTTNLEPVDASVSPMLTGLFYEMFRDFNLGGNEAEKMVGSPEEINKLYQESGVAPIISQEEFAAIRAYTLGFDKHINPNLGKVNPFEKRKNTFITYIASGLDKLKGAGYRYPLKETVIEKLFDKSPALKVKFRDESILTELMVPIPQIPDFHVEKEAVSGQIFYVAKNDEDKYELVRKDNGRRYNLKGVFSYVILPDEPDRIYCGMNNGQQNSKGELNEYRHHNPYYVEGHSSLAQGKDVLYAGDFLFEDGQLKLWTNGSGHYKPIAERRFGNLTEAVKRILPEELFKDHDELTEVETKTLNAYIQISEAEERRLKECYSNSSDADTDSDSDSDSDGNDLSIFNKIQAKNGRPQLPGNPGLKGGGPAQHITQEEVCAPIANALDKKPGEDGPDKGGAGAVAGALSGAIRSGATSDSDSEDETKPDRPSGSANAIIPPTAPGSNPAGTVGSSSAELQKKLNIALNSGGQIKAIQIGRMLEFTSLLAKASPAVQATAINSEVFNQSSELLKIPGYYFNTRFPSQGAAQVPAQIKDSLMQSLANCVRAGTMGEQAARNILPPDYLRIFDVKVETVNIFADINKEVHATAAINLLIGTADQRRVKIAADNSDIAVRGAEKERVKRRVYQGAAELKKYSVDAGARDYKNFLNERVQEERERQNMLRQSQAEKQEKYEKNRAARGAEWSRKLNEIALSETDKAKLNHANRKQEQEDSWRSVQLSKKTGDLTRGRSDSTTSFDSGINSPGALSRSSSRSSIISEVTREISNMRGQLNPGTENNISAPTTGFSHEEWPSNRSTEKAQSILNVLEGRVASRDRFVEREIESIENTLKSLPGCK